MRAHASASNPGHAVKANARGARPAEASPGATLHAISAASIGIVPEPHIGSTSGESPRQPEPSTIAAASVSRSGAFASACR